MAPAKRKRNSTRFTPKKQPKYTSSDHATPTLSASDTFYEADCILQERTIDRKTSYLIKWKGYNPDTNQEWTPTWEPKSNANSLLLKEWEEKKARSASSIPGKQQKRGRTRKRPIIDSSSDPSAIESPLLSAASTPAPRRAIPATSSALTSPTGASATPARTSPHVEITARGESFAPEDFERFSQTVASQSQSKSKSQSQAGPTQTQVSELDSSQLFAISGPCSLGGIIPDSQSSAGEGSFIPSTQRTGNSSEGATASNTESHGEQTEENSVSFLFDSISSKPANRPGSS